RRRAGDGEHDADAAAGVGRALELDAVRSGREGLAGRPVERDADGAEAERSVNGEERGRVPVPLERVVVHAEQQSRRSTGCVREERDGGAQGRCRKSEAWLHRLTLCRLRNAWTGAL